MPLEEFEPSFDAILKRVGGVRRITPETRMLEVGAGIGWFEVICAKRGLSCSAIEFNPVIRDAALEFARRHGVEVDIRLGDVQDAALGQSAYDVVVAVSVFEHVRYYGRGLAKIYEALRPGGVLYLESTNKFSLRSGEYPQIPLYGWLPSSVRQRVRVSRQGRAIVTSSGIDFNQFTYWGLSKHLRSLGFSDVFDRVEFVESRDLLRRTPARVLALRATKALPPLKASARAFAIGNAFVCVK